MSVNRSVSNLIDELIIQKQEHVFKFLVVQCFILFSIDSFDRLCNDWQLVSPDQLILRADGGGALSLSTWLMVIKCNKNVPFLGYLSTPANPPHLLYSKAPSKIPGLSETDSKMLNFKVCGGIASVGRFKRTMKITNI